jgi:hypothetical protein
MDKRKLNNGEDNREVSVMIHVNIPDYFPDWLIVRHRITDTTFTAVVKRGDLSRLETDQIVISYSINEELDP